MKNILFSISLVAAAVACRSDPQQTDGSAADQSQSPAAGSQTPLLNTWWRITMLDTLTIPADTGQRAPHLQITEESGGGLRYSSTVGCNGVGGDATIDGDRITFGPGMSTKMWCGEVLNERETRLQAALSGTRRYAITGDTLELRDDAGARVAQFLRGIAPG